MILDLDLNDSIYENLETTATERGITVGELIRWVIGDYIQYSRPPTGIAFPAPLPPSPMEQENAKVMKLSGLLMKSMINQGTIKCSNCTLALTVEDFDNGKCSRCGAKI